MRYNDLFQLIKDSDPYKGLGSNVGQGTLRMLDKAWKSFFMSIKDWSKNPTKYLGKPKLPRYKPKKRARRQGRNTEIHRRNV